MNAAEIERAAHNATVALSEFDRAGVTTVLQTVPALAQTLRELLAAVTAPSSPPADDVREALAECVHTSLRRDDWGVANEDEREEPLAVSDAILAAFEVHPRGTLTDAPNHPNRTQKES